MKRRTDRGKYLQNSRGGYTINVDGPGGRAYLGNMGYIDIHPTGDLPVIQVLQALGIRVFSGAIGLERDPHVRMTVNHPVCQVRALQMRFSRQALSFYQVPGLTISFRSA